MDRTIVLVGLLTALTSLAGCFGGSDPDVDPYEPRTIEYTLLINADQQAYPLYTMNNGVDTVNVLAMGFELAGSDQDFEVPGPQLRANEGDTVIIHVINSNALPHTFHLHGNVDDWMDDGVPFVSQMPIHNGQEHTYVFEDIKAGTYWYHCHVDVAHHIDLGMYGAFIVEERKPSFDYDADLPEHVFMLDEWDNCHVHQTFGPLVYGSRDQTSDYEDLTECARTVIQDNLAQNTVGNQVGNNVPDPVRDPLCGVYADPRIPNETKDAIDPLWRQINCDDDHRVVPPQQSEREWYWAQFPVYKPTYNSYLINGKAFPDTKPIILEEGKTYRMRFINVGELSVEACVAARLDMGRLPWRSCASGSTCVDSWPGCQKNIPAAKQRSTIIYDIFVTGQISE